MDKPLYDMTIQIPIIKESPSLAASGGGGSAESGGPSKSWQVTQTGDTFLSMEREMESRTSLTLFYGHLQVLVISDSVAEAGLDKISDFFLRHREMRPKVDVYIAEDSAKKILDVNPKVEDHAATHLKQLPINSDRNSRIVYRSDLGETMNCIRSGNDFVLPKVEATKEEIKVKGGALFKRAKMVGWVDEIDIESINFIRNLYRRGVVVGNRPSDEPGIITLEVTKSKAKIKPMIIGNELNFDISFKIQGEYGGQVGFATDKQADNIFIEKCEKEFSRVIEEQCKKTIKKMQREYNVDVFQFNKILRTQKPAYWEEIKENWDEIFPNARINLKVETRIKVTGAMK
ncbi:MAG TPA: Ger(x)C family spore germination protein [Clostridia bacterium]|nr:Ger(x)C family spore germination protein [Clostridia bacterium]